MKMLSHTTWGSDRKFLLNMYRSLVLSRLYYSAEVYDAATPSVLKMFNLMPHLGIRISTGAFRTSPVPSLYASYVYFLKVNANSEHPCSLTVNDTSCAARFQ